MVAVRTDVRQDQLPDDLKPLLRKIAHAVPAGVGKGHGRVTKRAEAWLGSRKPPRDLSDKQTTTTLEQFGTLGFGRESERVNCHHNFAARERHGGKDLWVTRKGAIKADVGDLGIIPGSMGARTFIVRGKGNELSYNSCSHGAGRKMSRTQARKQIPLETFREEM